MDNRTRLRRFFFVVRPLGRAILVMRRRCKLLPQRLVVGPVGHERFHRGIVEADRVLDRTNVVADAYSNRSLDNAVFELMTGSEADERAAGQGDAQKASGH